MKSQVSFEFIMIFSLILASLIIFTYAINQRLADINEQQERLLLKNLANNIESEVILASSVNNNYLRKFNIPYKINAKAYKMYIKNDELNIDLLEENKTISNLFTVFPISVKGNFIEDIGINTTEHCITKNNFDGIRIARNQASLDPDPSEVTVGSTVSVVLSLNCVENIRSARFTIKYNPEKLQLDSVEPLTYISYPEMNPLFDDLLGEPLDYEGRTLTEQFGSLPYIDPNIARYTYAFIGQNCATGSGTIARMRFTALSSGFTEVEFDPDFADQELMILDCTTNKLTKEGIPDSKSSAQIRII